MRDAAPQVAQFGVFEFDLRARELRKRGLKIKLQEQPLQALMLLLQQAGEIVTRDEFREKLWNAAIIVDFDHSLNTTINKLREALDDSAHTPRFIETVPRRGYRFVYPVSGAADTRVTRRRHAHSLNPQTKYAKSGGVYIAYQVVGQGTRDLVFVQGWVSHVEYAWEDPDLAKFLERLASFSRLIVFDRRGTGLSDRVAAVPTLEERMDD